MKSWSPLWSTLITSSIWGETQCVRILWITMLAIKDADGFVEGTIPGLSRLAVLSIEETQQALAVLEAPDPMSRTPEHEGRRIESAPGGWRVLNHHLYRDEIQAERRRAYQARWQRERRAKLRQGKPLPGEAAYCAKVEAHGPEPQAAGAQWPDTSH